MKTPYNDLNSMTEKDLRQKADQLRILVENGNATIGQANRLAQMESIIRQINFVARSNPNPW